MIIRKLLFLVIIVPGIAGIIIFGHFALKDWDQLQIDYQAYKEVVQSSDDLPTLFKVEAAQNLHRINLFGRWSLDIAQCNPSCYWVSWLADEAKIA